MKKNIPPLLLCLLVLFIGWRVSPNFLDAAYLRDSATLMAEIGIIAIAMNYVIAAGQIDLSVGSNMVLTACVTAKLLQWGLPIPLALIVGVGFAALLGWLNGLLITYFQVPSFLVTVATLAIFRGAAKALLGPASVKAPASLVGIDTSTMAWLTVPLWILLGFGLASVIVLNRTVFGAWVLAVGSNQRTAFYSGVPVSKVIRSTFLISGMFSGVAALLMLSRLGIARADLANGAELDVITIVVVGGTLIQGGSANVIGSMLAFLMISLLRTAMGVASVTAEYQMTMIGALLVIAVLAKNVNIRIPSRKRSPIGQSVP
ncbi:MAG: ABC transporter permease [Armatimonadota bacterium]